MDENYEINTKLYGFGGILGRRDYCINLIYILVIMFLINCPFAIYLSKKLLSFDEILRYNEFFYGAPLILVLISLLTSIAVGALLLSNVHRRLTDILGRKSSFLTTVFGIMILTSFLWFIFPYTILGKLFLLTLVWSVFLIFMPGSITSKLPYDYTKIFNWGAFLGTWMWGFYNKSYITLFQWAVGPTPFGFLFKIYCGLKGNEWAYKNKKYDDLEKFNKSQRRQTVFFIFWNFVILPLLLALPLILIFTYTLTFNNYYTGCAIKQDEKPPIVKQVNRSQEKVDLDGLYKFLANLYFESYEFTNNENKFYLDTDEYKWKDSSIFDKCEIMDKALKISKGYRYKENRIKNPNKCPAANSYDEMRKIKIYSAKTGQLIGEYNTLIDDNAFTLKDAMSIWKFYDLSE